MKSVKDKSLTTKIQKKKMREEEAEIGLYLGRSYVEDKEYEKAMRAYSDAPEELIV